MKRIKRETGIPSVKGAVSVIAAVLLTVFIGIAALAVDVGYMMTARNELQNAADGAALAAARKLGHTYECGTTGATCVPMPYAQQLTYVADAADLIAVAQNVTLNNKAAGSGITLDAADVVIGTWNGISKTLTPTLTSPDAVRVTVRRDGTTNGPISTLFAKFLGTNTVNVTATATAALTGQSTAGAGGLPVPIGISQLQFDKYSGTGFCGAKIQMHPTKDSCAAWHTFESGTHSSSQLEQILQDLLPAALRDKKYKNDPLYVSPAATIYDTQFNFTGGDLANNFDDFENLFNYMKDKDGDADDTVWTTAVVVYQESGASCGNPSGLVPIVSFATIKISEVIGPSSKTIWGEIQCDLVDDGRGGGAYYGTKGSIPGLVQ